MENKYTLIQKSYSFKLSFIWQGKKKEVIQGLRNFKNNDFYLTKANAINNYNHN